MFSWISHLGALFFHCYLSPSVETKERLYEPSKYQKVPVEVFVWNNDLKTNVTKKPETEIVYVKSQTVKLISKLAFTTFYNFYKSKLYINTLLY